MLTKDCLPCFQHQVPLSPLVFLLHSHLFPGGNNSLRSCTFSTSNLHCFYSLSAPCSFRAFFFPLFPGTSPRAILCNICVFNSPRKPCSGDATEDDMSTKISTLTLISLHFPLSPPQYYLIFSLLCCCCRRFLFHFNNGMFILPHAYTSARRYSKLYMIMIVLTSCHTIWRSAVRYTSVPF